MRALLGGIFLLMGGGMLGYAITARQRQRIRAIAALRGGLYQIERELRQQLTPLPILLQQEGLPFSSAFSDCGRALDEGIPLIQCWDRLVGQLPHLGEEERGLLRPLGQILGRFEGEIQGEALLRVAQDLELLGGQLEGDRRRLCRVYPALGVTAGAFLAIILV